MIRIAFLGSDSTHTEAFARLVNTEQSPFHSMARITSIWGADLQQTRDKARALGIDRVVDSPGEALADADLAMVIGRFGESHFEPAMLAMQKGLPTFVDKPFTTNIGQARELARFSEKNSVPLFSSSPLRFAREVIELKKLVNEDPDFRQLSVTCPKNCIELGPDPRFESVFFYGIHALEVVLEIMGADVKSFRFMKTGKQVSIYLDFGARTATVHMLGDVNEFYSITAFSVTSRQMHEIALDGTYYKNLLHFALGDFVGGRATIPLQSTLKAIDILQAIEVTLANQHST